MVPLAASLRSGISRRASSKLKHSDEGRKGGGSKRSMGRVVLREGVGFGLGMGDGGWGMGSLTAR